MTGGMTSPMRGERQTHHFISKSHKMEPFGRLCLDGRIILKQVFRLYTVITSVWFNCRILWCGGVFGFRNRKYLEKLYNSGNILYQRLIGS